MLPSSKSSASIVRNSGFLARQQLSSLKVRKVQFLRFVATSLNQVLNIYLLAILNQHSPRQTKPRNDRFASQFEKWGTFLNSGCLPWSNKENSQKIGDFQKMGAFNNGFLCVFPWSFQGKQLEFRKVPHCCAPCESASFWFGLPRRA